MSTQPQPHKPQARPSRALKGGAIIATILTTTALSLGPVVAGAGAATHPGCDTRGCGADHSEGLVSTRS